MYRRWSVIYIMQWRLNYVIYEHILFTRYAQQISTWIYLYTYYYYICTYACKRFIQRITLSRNIRDHGNSHGTVMVSITIMIMVKVKLRQSRTMQRGATQHGVARRGATWRESTRREAARRDATQSRAGTHPYERWGSQLGWNQAGPVPRIHSRRRLGLSSGGEPRSAPATRACRTSASSRCHMYIYIYVYSYMYMYIYIYIYVMFARILYGRCFAATHFRHSFYASLSHPSSMPSGYVLRKRLRENQNPAGSRSAESAE